MGRESQYEVNEEAADFGHCPKCGEGLLVIDSRKNVGSVRRRRKCGGCDYRFTTMEVMVEEWDTLKSRAGLVDDFAAAALKLVGEINPIREIILEPKDRAQQMAELYTITKMSLATIGKRFGVSRETVRRALKRNGVQLRAKHERPESP